MDQQTKTRGISFFTLLFIVFLVLKLAGIGEVAHWSWWWVTAPLWMPTAIAVAFVLGTLAIGFIIFIFAAIFGR